MGSGNKQPSDGYQQDTGDQRRVAMGVPHLPEGGCGDRLALKPLFLTTAGRGR